MTPGQSLLRAATGLNLSRQVVERAIRQRMAQTGIGTPDAYLQQMKPDELTALVELVVVPESWFFRDPQAFHAMADLVRTRLAANGERQVRILSIPCAGGEEPYTMAMTLADAGIAPQHFLIDAVDISAACVARAVQGVYGRNAFRAADLSFRDAHFASIGGGEYRINDDIRKQVRFRQGNLLEGDFSPAGASYDVIFCRNLLIYFDKAATRAAIARLKSLLAEDGQLFAGYAEVPSFCQHGFAPLSYSQAFGLQKKAAAPARKPLHLPHAPSRVPPRAARTIASPPSLPPSRLPPPRPAAAPAIAVAQPAGADLLSMARRLADLGDLAAAASRCRDHLALHPESAEAYFMLGLLSELNQQPRMAEDYWKRCIYLQPDHYEALCHLALLAESNQDAGAAATLKARAARIYQRQQSSKGEQS
jgi:chemotaxis protein methyltransferase WspC